MNKQIGFKYLIVTAFLFFMIAPVAVIVSQLLGNYHRYLYSSNRFSWYGLFCIGPLFLSIVFGALIVGRNKKILIPRALIISQIVKSVCLLIGVCVNLMVWGYAIKRPIVFSEVRNLDKVKDFYSIYNFKENITSFFFDGEKAFSEPKTSDISFYYQNRLNSVLWGMDEGYKQELSRKQTREQLIPQINDFLEVSTVPRYNNEYRFGPTSVTVLSFRSNSKDYLFIGTYNIRLLGDHFGVYEYLFEVNNNKINVVDQEVYYYDSAGIEEFEMGMVFPYVLLFILLLEGLFVGIKRIVSFRQVKRI